MKTKEEYIADAKENFKKGYSCAQAVVCAFADELGIDSKTAVKIASSFGAGMGGLREVCGAATGMFMCAGLKYGYDDPSKEEAYKIKKEHYALIRKMAEKFAETSGGSIICRELLKMAPKKQNIEADKTSPSPRTAEYYKKRPCTDLVGDAAGIFADLLINGKSNEK